MTLHSLLFCLVCLFFGFHIFRLFKPSEILFPQAIAVLPLNWYCYGLRLKCCYLFRDNISKWQIRLHKSDISRNFCFWSISVSSWNGWFHGQCSARGRRWLPWQYQETCISQWEGSLQLTLVPALNGETQSLRHLKIFLWSHRWYGGSEYLCSAFWSVNSGEWFQPPQNCCFFYFHFMLSIFMC